MDVLLVFLISAFLAIASIVVLSVIILRSVSRKGKEESVVKGWLLGVLIGLLILNMGLAIFFFFQIHEQVTVRRETTNRENVTGVQTRDEREREESREERDERAERQEREERAAPTEKLFEGSPFNLTPRAGFQIMQIQNSEGSIELDVPVATRDSYSHFNSMVIYSLRGVSASVEIGFHGGNLRRQFALEVLMNEEVMNDLEHFSNVVVDEEIFETENALMQRIFFTYELLDRESEGVEYIMAFEYMGGIIIVNLSVTNFFSGADVDCHIKTVKEVLGFNYFLGGEAYICPECDPYRLAHLPSSTEENPFDLSPRESFEIVHLYNDSVKLEVPLKETFFGRPMHGDGWATAGLYGVGVRIHLYEEDRRSYMENFEWGMSPIVSSMNREWANRAYSNVEVSEMHRIENGVMQWVTYLYCHDDLGVSEIEGITYFMAFSYMGYTITVKIEAANLRDDPDFERGLELAREVYGVKRFLESETLLVGVQSSMEENPFDLSEREGFTVVELLNLHETIKLEVSVPSDYTIIPGSTISPPSLLFNDHDRGFSGGISIHQGHYMEVLERWVAITTEAREEDEFFFSDVEVGEILFVENGALQIVSSTYHFYEEYEWITYFMTFDYLGETILVTLEFSNLRDYPYFEEVAELIKEHFGVNRFFEP